MNILFLKLVPLGPGPATFSLLTDVQGDFFQNLIVNIIDC